MWKLRYQRLEAGAVQFQPQEAGLRTIRHRRLPPAWIVSLSLIFATQCTARASDRMLSPNLQYRQERSDRMLSPNLQYRERSDRMLSPNLQYGGRGLQDSAQRPHAAIRYW